MRISIITPNYNYAHYLPELLESLLLQTYTNWEHIIIDDGSTDHSVELIQSYVKKYPTHFKLVMQENAGQSKALNHALELVTGDLIMWINSDDSFCPDIFEPIVDIFRDNADLEVLFGDIKFMDMQSRYMFLHRNQPFRYIEAALLGFTMYVSSNAVVWKSERMKVLDGFKSDFKCNMDGEFFSRLFHNANYSYAPIAIANFRKQPFSKAAENDNRWTELMNKEIAFELLNSKERLSNELGKKVAWFFPILRNFYRLKRAIYRKITKRDQRKKVELETYQKRIEQ